MGYRSLTTMEVALTVTFTALYAVFGLVRISPIIGLSAQGITAAAIVAPIIGIVLGPYVGALSTFLGGTIGFFLGALYYPSFASGIAAAFCAGMIKKGLRTVSVVVYASLLLLFAFYPTVGPAWLFPPETWFQIAGLIILVSPLQSAAARSLESKNNSRLLIGFFITCLTSTLTGQIAGSLVFEVLVSDPKSMSGIWEGLTFLYPVERIIIALGAMLIGASLSRALKSASLQRALDSGHVVTKSING